MLSMIYQMLDKIVLHTLYLSPLHQCYCNDVPIQGVPPHPPHHHNNQVFFLVSPMICTKWVMFRMQGTTEHNQWSEKMTVFFNHFELITDCIATYKLYHKLFKNHYWGHCCHHQHLVSLCNRTAPRKGPQKNVSNMTRLSLAYYVAIFTKHYCVLVFNKKICLKEDEIWWKIISKKNIVTLVTQGLSSSFLCLQDA